VCLVAAPLKLRNASPLEAAARSRPFPLEGAVARDARACEHDARAASPARSCRSRTGSGSTPPLRSAAARRASVERRAYRLPASSTQDQTFTPSGSSTNAPHETKSSRNRLAPPGRRVACAPLPRRSRGVAARSRARDAARRLEDAVARAARTSMPLEPLLQLRRPSLAATALAGRRAVPLPLTSARLGAGDGASSDSSERASRWRVPHDASPC